MEITATNILEMADVIMTESRKYRYGLIERINREGDIYFDLRSYDVPTVSRAEPNKVEIQERKRARLTLRGDEPIVIID
ncbi:hypothetical protein NVP1164O_22 [Vibrio phage 1.164.O._10N.261.51.A7]|nr:hypothetical protein NVP1164O_22 [Vibrio phage 1.164.O._10N.261.51.A7]